MFLWDLFTRKTYLKMKNRPLAILKTELRANDYNMY